MRKEKEKEKKLRCRIHVCCLNASSPQPADSRPSYTNANTK